MTIVAAHADIEVIGGLSDGKSSVMMDAGEDPPAGHRIGPRARVAPSHEHPLAHQALVVPLDGDSVGRIFRSDAEPGGQKGRANVFQADQADACHAVPGDDLGPEGRRQLAGQDLRIDPVIDQDPPIDEATNDGDSHLLLPRRTEELTALLGIQTAAAHRCLTVRPVELLAGSKLG